MANIIGMLPAVILLSLCGISAVSSQCPDIHPGFGAVTDLTITPVDNNWRIVLLTWAPPIGFEACTITYTVIIADNPPIEVDQPEYAILLTYCTTTTISVVPVIGGVAGILISEDVTLDVPEGFVSIYGMEAERFDVFLEAIWERLPGFEACSIIYRVTLNDSEEQETTRTEIRFDLPEETCVDHTIKVTPMVGDISGSPFSETVHIGGCRKNLHGST